MGDAVFGGLSKSKRGFNEQRASEWIDLDDKVYRKASFFTVLLDILSSNSALVVWDSMDFPKV